MRYHEYRLKTGITRTREFERKGLACFAVNCGLKCGHDCLYCSTGAVLRTHKAFKEFGENPFGHGYCTVEPERRGQPALLSVWHGQGDAPRVERSIHPWGSPP